MAKVSSHFVRGNNPKKFAKTLVNFMSKVRLKKLTLVLHAGILCDDVPDFQY